MRNPLPVVVALTLSIQASLAAEAALPRHPAPSPDGAEVAFSWQGDVWVVSAEGGTARRLTAHPAADRRPIWSRDGRWIAFSSHRFGNADVFVMAADGSVPPRRLTFNSTDDRAVDFLPDSRAVLFASRRDASIRRTPGLYRVGVEGGTPVLEQPALGLTASYSPSGERLVFVRGGTKPYRSGYRGSASRDLWLREADGTFERLTSFDGDDDFPSWIDETRLLFLSTRQGRKNIHLLDLNSRDVSPLTSYQDHDARSPRASADGSLVAYAHRDAIYTMASGDWTPRRISIDVPSDWIAARVERKLEHEGASELSIHPDGKLAAFVLHGDVFVTGVRSKDDQLVAKAPTVRVTRTSEREADLSWTPDGERLLFTSYRGGTKGLYTAAPADPEADGRWLTSFDFGIRTLVDDPAASESRARFSPDGAQVAFVRGNGQLVVANADGSEPRVVFDHWNIGHFAWSPDGRFLAYSANDVEFNSDVWIIPASGGEPYNVSRHPDRDVDPRWSPDGRRLIWRSKRHRDTLDLWSVWLSREDDERDAEDWLSVWTSKAKQKTRGNGKPEAAGDGTDAETEDAKDEDASKEVPKVEIDFEDLWRRSHSLTTLLGDEGPSLVVDEGRRILFTAALDQERDLYAVRWDGEGLERLTEGGRSPSALQLDDSGKTVYFLDRKGRVGRVSTSGKKGDPIPFAARYELDRREERRAIFHEGWDALRESFYDPAFHGVDWAAQREKYLPLALAASSPEDFADVMNWMLGELNASHMGYYPRRASGGERTGFIGAQFDASAGGPGLLVSRVFRGSPAARTDVDLRPGERLLAVAGTSLGATTNVYELFADTVSQRVPLKIRGEDGGEREVVVEPIGARRSLDLVYQAWVDERRRIVEELSGGRLAYLHVRSMSIGPFEDFERDLYSAAQGREGLIIDVRANGGGWTTDYLMAALNVTRHAYTIPRGAPPETRAYPQVRLPLAAWTRPAIALCDEQSYSNAEIFSRAFRNTGRGLVVGTPTFGAVISTGATYMLNGARVRLPFRGWYDGRTGENQENNGFVPDIVVPRPPKQDTSSERDNQLRAAVEALLERLETDPRAGSW